MPSYDDSSEDYLGLPLSNDSSVARVAFLNKMVYSMPTMSQERLIQIKNKESGETYWTRKNKKGVERKIELKKYSKKLRKHVTFKEAKK